MQAEGLQRAQDLGRAAGDLALAIQILQTHQPAAPVRTGIQKAPERCDQGAQMQRAGG